MVLRKSGRVGSRRLKQAKAEREKGVSRKAGSFFGSPRKLWGKKKIVVLLYGNRLRTIITRRSTDLF